MVCDREVPVRTLITNANVLVIDGRTLPQRALVLQHGRIVGVGAADEMAVLAGRSARHVDVSGATVMPGIVDTHPHILHFAAMMAPVLDITDAASHDEIVERIRRRASVTPKGQWIVTTPVGEPHYFRRRSYRDLEERRLPDRHVLDRATTEHPVWLQAWGPIQPGVCAFNSAGLKAIHVSDAVPDVVSNVRFDKNLRGELTGTVRGAVTTYLNHDPYWGQIQTKILMQIGRGGANFGGVTSEVLKASVQEYHARGVTAGYECHVMTSADLDAYRKLRAEGGLTMRIMACLEPEAGFHHFPPDPPRFDGIFERLEAGRAMKAVDDDLLRIAGLSMSLGGPCSAGHFMTYEPYPDPYGQPTYGYQATPDRNCHAFVDFCAKHGERMNLITGSYPEHDLVIELAGAAAARYGRSEAWILQHAVLMNPAQVRQFRALDFAVSTNVSFTWGKGDIYADRMGRHVMRDLVPLRRQLDAGLQVSLGSDWGPRNYWEHIRLAETHEMCGNGQRNDGPDQVVTREEALAMWTREGGRMMNWQGIGTLEPGSWADLIVVDRDPSTCDIDALPQTRVLRTVVGGRTVFDSGDLSSADAEERTQ
jgi:predicted amidohydrolase YtcJ